MFPRGQNFPPNHALAAGRLAHSRRKRLPLPKFPSHAAACSYIWTAAPAPLRLFLPLAAAQLCCPVCVRAVRTCRPARTDHEAQGPGGLQNPAKCATIGRAKQAKRNDGESTRCASGAERGSTGCKGPRMAAARKFAPERPAGTAGAPCPVVRDGAPRYGVRVPRRRRTCAEFGWYHGVKQQGSVPWLV